MNKKNTGATTKSTPLCQFFTPLWVAEALVERHFPDLDADDLVVEPSCGYGAFLAAIPQNVQAVGVEIDPLVAQVAHSQTGRDIVVGDFRTVQLTVKPTAIVGNPPFVASVFDAFLDRCHSLLPEGGRAGFILPTYFFQTAGRVAGYADRWSINHELIPRNAFNDRMKTPLSFAVFSKDARRLLVGFALYRETADLRGFAVPYRDALSMTRGPLWKRVCEIALQRLGGEAPLADIYAELENNRPTRTDFWREKIRQTLRVYTEAFQPVAPGRYALTNVLG